MEFADEVLAEEIQSVYFLDEGFPVNQNAAGRRLYRNEEFIAGLLSPESGD